MERFFLAALCRAPGVGSRVAASLVRVFGSAQDAWHARAEALRAAHLSSERAATLHDFCRRNEALPEKIAAACEKGGISLFVTLVGTPFFIKILVARQYGQFIRQEGQTRHQINRVTHTMG